VDPTYGLPLLAALGYSLHLVHQIALREKHKAHLLRRAIGGHKRIRFRMPARSPRSEMRAYDHPTTVMEAIGKTTQSQRGQFADVSR